MAAYFESTAPRDTWHRVMDLLTVRYFQLTGEDTDQLYAENEGDRHTGLSAADMRNPKRLLDAYRESLRAAVQCVFDSRLRDRS